MYRIFTYIWLMFMVNAGKKIPYMNPMGHMFIYLDRDLTKV